MKDHGLIDEAAAPEVADRHDQTRATVAIAQIELGRLRPSAAVLSLGMCPEPAPIKPDNLIQRAPSRKACATRAPGEEVQEGKEFRQAASHEGCQQRRLGAGALH